MADPTVIQHLKLGVVVCDQAISSLKDRPRSQDALPPDLAVVHKDFISLLSLLYAATTKLSLALKPSSPTYNASVTPLKDITAHVNALAHCTGLFDGATLQKEVSSTATGVIESVRDLLQTFLDIDSSNDRENNTGQAGDLYLVKTGAVHHQIDRARSNGGLSQSNIDAVGKILLQNQGSLDDAVAEAKELLADHENPEDIDDGWDELGITSPEFTKEELEQMRKVHLILRMSSLLHGRIRTDLLSSDGVDTLDLTTLDEFPPLSQKLQVAFDEMVAMLYLRVPEDAAAECRSFQELVGQLRTQCQPWYPPSEPSPPDANGKKRKNIEKWFTTCFDQLEKALNDLLTTLEQSS
ncbi:hypothetical protein BDN72DRAFT_831016 [Pluteus cervinus]|uniref:Uncharacterized protein n=1 Tax=Pluteus cervinus TaxID=181527 RepID=A0ACD3BEI0_9AGAR|nr:hypothetical protein BDN72DRAFT_831016 [Pluteus cervinus]